MEPLLESAHFFMFPCGKHFLAITGARVLCYQVEDTTAQAPEFLPSTVKVPRPSLLPPQPFQSTVHPADLGETPEFVEVFEKRNPIMIWRQSQETFSLQSCANGDHSMLPTRLQGIFQKDSASYFNLQTLS